MLARAIVVLLFGVLVGVPLALRPRTEQPHESVRTLVVITPHSEQIRSEFGAGFAKWHEREFGEAVAIDFRAPGGTSEIRRLLEAQMRAAVLAGLVTPEGDARSGAMSYDILFGGGSYEHDQLKRGVAVDLPAGAQARVPINAPLSVAQAQLETWFPENAIGPGLLYDPDQHWVASALTSFGIVYNRDLLRERGLPEPAAWTMLADPRYDGWLAMTDPRQSGSVATAFDAILSHYGWDEGWRVLRAMCANARGFGDSSQKAPIDVSQAEAMAGVSIGFYGRVQSQMAAPKGRDEGRVGFIDPPGMTYIDADPISIIRGGPDPVLAARFVAYVMSVEGQALWQFPATGDDASTDALGPRQHELRRMPARRVMYDEHRRHFVDQGLRPFEDVTTTPMRGWRSMIAPILAAASIDIHTEQVAAWRALTALRQEGAPQAVLDEAERLFYAMPTHTLPDGSQVLLDEANFNAVREDWRDSRRAAEHRIAYTRFFRAQYAQVVRLADEWRATRR